MSRWVDADLIAQQMRELPHEYSNKEQRARTGGIASCQEIVREAPSLDLVRCAECKYWQDNNGGYPTTECRWGHDETPNPDDFCSYGCRKESE